jgi:hypothetical protein
MTICSKVCHIMQSEHRYGGLRSPSKVRVEGNLSRTRRFCDVVGCVVGIGILLYSFLQVTFSIIVEGHSR